MKILAMRFGALGDVLNVFPAIRGLKAAMPEAEVSWLVEEAAAPLVQANADVAKVFVMPRRRWRAAMFRPGRMLPLPLEVSRFVREIRREKYDVALDFQCTLKSGVTGALTGIARRIAFAPPHGREMSHLFATERVKLPSLPMPRALKNLALVRALAPQAQCEGPRLRFSREDSDFADALMRQVRGGARYLVAMHPGTSDFGRFKRWPAQRYADVARLLREKLGAATLVTWGPNERDLAERVVSLSHGAATVAPETTLTQLGEVIRRLDLFVASDTGPLHLAAVLGRAVVAIFGPKDPVIYGPYGCPGIIVRKDLDCSPCKKRRCRHVDCIMKIQAEEVLEAAVTMLERNASAGRGNSGAAGPFGNAEIPNPKSQTNPKSKIQNPKCELGQSES